MEVGLMLDSQRDTREEGHTVGWMVDVGKDYEQQ